MRVPVLAPMGVMACWLPASPMAGLKAFVPELANTAWTFAPLRAVADAAEQLKMSSPAEADKVFHVLNAS
jgi:hypothetical protein